MSGRATRPVLCAAALSLAAVPGLSRVGVVVGIAPARSWKGVQYVWALGAYVAAPYVHAVGSPEPGSGMAPAGCGLVGTGGTGGDEAGWSHASDAAGQEEPPRAM